MLESLGDDTEGRGANMTSRHNGIRGAKVPEIPRKRALATGRVNVETEEKNIICRGIALTGRKSFEW